MLRDIFKYAITAFTCFAHISSLERETKTLRSRVGLVNGEVTPPNSSIIPEMVVGVIVIDA